MKNNSSGCLIFLIVIAIAVIISIILENPIAAVVVGILILICAVLFRYRKPPQERENKNDDGFNINPDKNWLDDEEE